VFFWGLCASTWLCEPRALHVSVASLRLACCPTLVHKESIASQIWSSCASAASQHDLMFTGGSIQCRWVFPAHTEVGNFRQHQTLTMGCSMQHVPSNCLNMARDAGLCP